VTDKALLEGAEEERAEEEDEELDLEEGGWAAQDRAPAPRVSVCAPNAVLLLPIKSVYPAISYSAPSVAHPWSENNTRRFASKASDYKITKRSSVMDSVDAFQRLFGGRWTGVTFYFDELPTVNEHPVRNIRFCEAIKRSLIQPVLLRPEDLNCHGARYVFGWDETVKTEMVKRFHYQEGFTEAKAKELVQNLPKIGGALKGIGLNIRNDPDLLLSYLQPGQAMKLIRSYQVYFGKALNVDLSSIVSVCGHVAVEAVNKKQIALSFGCRDAREYGGITRDRVAIGVPVELAKAMVEKKG
jgi:uncharacterized protein (DUF169 family)